MTATFTLWTEAMFSGVHEWDRDKSCETFTEFLRVMREAEYDRDTYTYAVAGMNPNGHAVSTQMSVSDGLTSTPASEEVVSEAIENSKRQDKYTDWEAVIDLHSQVYDQDEDPLWDL